MTVSLGLLGAGRIGRTHAKTVADVDGARISKVFDAVAEAASDVAHMTGAKITGIDEIVGDPSIDGIIIATPTEFHSAQIELAAASGKAIFCEKPIDLDIARAEAAVMTAEDHGVPLMVGFNRRFDPSFRRLKDVVAEGGVGAVETVIITSRDPSPPPLNYIKNSGGLFRDMMIHDFDMARFLLEEPIVSVSAHGVSLVDPAIAAAGDVDTAAVTLVSESGVPVVITNSRRATYGYDQRIEVHGSTGMVQAGNPAKTSVTVSSGAGSLGDTISDFFMDRYADAYRIELQTFCALIRGDSAQYPTGRDGIEALRLADAAVAAFAARTAVEIG